jgi:hypothetical protein
MDELADELRHPTPENSTTLIAPTVTVELQFLADSRANERGAVAMSYF